MAGSAFNPASFGKKLAVGVAAVVGGATIAAGTGWWNPSGTFGPIGGGGGGNSAHVWVSPTGNDTCTRSSSLVTQSAAVTGGNVCLTFDKAASISSCGDTDYVATGTFAAETISEAVTDACSSVTKITFKADASLGPVVKGVAGAACVDGGACGLIVSGATNLVFDGLYAHGFRVFVYNTSQGTKCGTGTRGGNCFFNAHDITFQNGHCGSQFMGCRLFSSPNVQMINNDISSGGCPAGVDKSFASTADCSASNGTPIIDIRSQVCNANNGSCGAVSSVQADGTGDAFINNRIHDVLYTNGTDHLQCLGVWGARNVTISGNTMWDCDGNQGLFLTTTAGGDAGNTTMATGTVTNNFIGSNCNGSSCGVATAGLSLNTGSLNVLDALVIRNNSLVGTTSPLTTLTPSGAGSVTIQDNIFATSTPSCDSGTGVTQDHNYFTNATGCAGDVNLGGVSISTLYNNPLNGATTGALAVGAPDLTLTSTGITDFKGHGATCEATDINGTSRPGSCTVGAWEAP